MLADRYLVEVYNDRQILKDYADSVFVWDVDKTYLDTHFSSFKGLARIPWEFAPDKVAIAGMPEILRGLRRGAAKNIQCNPIYFISASPPQLRNILAAKMQMDGVEYDGMTFKNWLKVMKKLNFKRLKNHLGYKVMALLLGRRNYPMAREYLFGDDAEYDPAAFNLYARVINSGLGGNELEAVLDSMGILNVDKRPILELVEDLPDARGTVAGVFIRKTGVVEKPMPAGCVVFHTTFALADILWSRGLIPVETVAQIEQVGVKRIQ